MRIAQGEKEKVNIDTTEDEALLRLNDEIKKLSNGLLKWLIKKKKLIEKDCERKNISAVALFECEKENHYLTNEIKAKQEFVEAYRNRVNIYNE